METFIDNVKQLMSQAGWSQKDLADACGLHRPQVSDLLRSKHDPGLKLICKIAEAFGVEPAELLVSRDLAETS